jgi:hypothetical protein
MSEYDNDLLDEQEVAEEKTPSMSDYDSKGDEGAALGSVDKAAKSGGSAKARKGDKKNSEGKEKLKAGDPDRHSESVEITTKGGMINAMYQKFNGMTREDLQHLFASVMSEEILSAEEGELAEESYQKKLRDLSDSEITLSEEFKSKTAILFEAALQSKVAEETERLEANYQERLEEEVSGYRGELVEKVDSYLNYVVEQWMSDNQLAIQNGLRTEIAETFMNGMKELFVESYIDVPDTKIDLVDDLADQVEELEEALSSQTSESIKLMEQVSEMRKEQIVSEAVSDLADTQAEKFRNFFSSVDFENEQVFSEKVATVKEAHFSGVTTVAEELEVDEDQSAGTQYVESSPMMEQYLGAIRKISK